jgi:osmotically inducible protein OsmC
MSTLYKTKAIAVGGRNGHVHTEDNLLSTRLALPKSMGGKEDATNPEQLFAAGYAACFGNAVLHVARQQKIALKDADVEIDAEVGILARAEGGFKLEVSLAAVLSGVDQATAEKLVHTAHQVCPYSNATRGNIDVALSVQTR